MRIVTLVVASSVVLAGCSNKKDAEPPPTPVEVGTVSLQDVQQTWMYSGEVQPNVEVKLAFKQQGYIASLYQVRGFDGHLRNVQAGDLVPSGASLAKLRADEFQASVVSAKGQAKSMEGQLDSAKADLVAAQSEQVKTDQAFQRARGLYATQAMTRPDYDSAVAERKDGMAKTESALQSVEAHKGQLQAAEAQVASSRINLSDSSLSAPMSSFVVSKDVEVGALVSIGTPAFTLADTRTITIEFGVPDSLLSQFKMGASLPVTVEGLPSQQLTGTVSEIAASATSDSRVFKIKVKLRNANGALKVGMIAKVRVEQAAGIRKLPILPVAALISAQSGSSAYQVFVVTEENGKQIAHLRSVRTGQIIDRSVVIEDGLFPGERIILQRTNQLADGSIVRVVN
jgi:RND family efflux transporter MFP subunit